MSCVFLEKSNKRLIKLIYDPISSPVSCLLMSGSANLHIHVSIVSLNETFTPPPGMRHNPHYSFIIILLFYSAIISLYSGISRFTSHITSIPVNIYPTIIRSLSKKIQQNIFLRPYVNYYDKMHHEENCSCSAANISIKLHKTIYEIISTLLHKTHFKPPSSVCNIFLLRTSGASFIKCCAETILNLSLRSFLRYAYMRVIE